MAHHLGTVHAAPVAPKPPSFKAPEVKHDIIEAEFQDFKQKWEIYTQNVPNAAAPAYLLQCCSADLQSMVQKEHIDILARPVEEVMEAIKHLAVIDVMTCVKQRELIRLAQDHDEPIRQFVARVKGVSRSCKLTVKCTRAGCDTDVDFADGVVKMVVLNGLASEDVAREVLATPDLDDKSLAETIKIIEGRERADRSIKGMPGGVQAAVKQTTFKKMSRQDAQLKVKIKCKDCQGEFNKHAIGRAKDGGEELKTYEICKDCHKRKKKKKPET